MVDTHNTPNSNFVQEYWLDAWQRWVLTLDALRQRGNTYLERSAENAPHVLNFPFELVCDGRTLPRPVNYMLVRILPSDGMITDQAKPPFVVVDPRAGHGPGIGGMKHDSEIGVAMTAGHPCYFVGFLPEPMPDQTIEDVCAAEAAFLEEVARRHPEANGKPVVVGNCQAGWQLMMTAAIRPELFGPILLAGSPLSYWAGVHGRNPMRYLGGTLGGTWLTAMAGDLGNGIFDGANLVANFESLNPANTYWEKPYNLYSKVDTETPRFLGFETWWGSPVLLNANEMQWIADNLFVGNKLTSGEIHTSSGVRVDLRNIRSPIIVLCSWGDNITPPQQALGWITDLYEREDEIVANGQTIVYTLHQSIGHLGIFVSGKVATKEHAEFASCMEMIDLLPPGLYEAVITEVDKDTANPNLIHGRYLFRLELRTLDDIRALGTNSEEDNQRFATVARLSEVNHGLYRTLAQPAVKAMASGYGADLMRQLHPNRLRFAAFSDRNPAMAPVKALAETVRADRKPVSADNPLLTAEKVASTWITTCWESYRLARDAMTEAAFLATYGSPILQAMVGLGASTSAPAPAQRRIERDLAREATEARARADLEKRFEAGGLAEAVIRSIMHVRLPQGTADERGFRVLQAIHRLQPANRWRSMSEIKAMFRDQYMLLRLDEERAVRAIPRLLPDDAQLRREGWTAVADVLGASGEMPAEGRQRLKRIEELFALPAGQPKAA
jgi:pimeloyl-ACP methyl ester carboxylesterase